MTILVMIFAPKSDEEDSQQMKITLEAAGITLNTTSSAEATASPLYPQVIRLFSPYANPDQLCQLERAFNGEHQKAQPSLLEVTVLHLTVQAPHTEIQSNVRGDLPEPVTLVGHQEQLQQWWGGRGGKKKEGQEVPETVQLVGNQEQLQQLEAKKKEGQEVPETVQLVGNQEQLQQIGTKKKGGQEVPGKMKLVGHQEQLHTEAQMAAKKKEGQEVPETVQLVGNQEQLYLAVKEDQVQTMTQKMMTHQLHQAQAQAEIPENVGIKRNLNKKVKVTITNQSTTIKKRKKYKKQEQL